MLLFFSVILACSQPVEGNKSDSGDSITDTDEAGDTAVNPDSNETGSDDTVSGETAVDTEVVDPCTVTACERRLRDADGDKYGDPTNYLFVPPTTPWEDGYVSWDTGRDDCDDGDATVHPDAAEICNGIDDDCDHNVDGDAIDKTIWYVDGDGDGYGTGSILTVSCEQPLESAANTGDCVDTDASINPDGTELCDGIDDDCNGVVDDGADESTPGARPYWPDMDVDYYGDTVGAPQYICSASGEIEYRDDTGLMTWISDNDLDCVDTDSMINPSVVEVPSDGIDQNCDHSDAH